MMNTGKKGFTRKKGFTLIELTIVLGVIAILVALAMPSFQDALRKSRRSDAIDSILGLQLAQERWRANHTTYGQLGNPYDPLTFPQTFLGPDPLDSTDEHYELDITVFTATNYTIVATAQGDQANDYCGNFVLTNALGVITKTNPGSPAASNPELCWRE